MPTQLRQAYEVSLARSSNSIGLQEILFLMRKDKVKLVRLLKHLSFKDSLASTMSSVSGTIPPTGSSPYSSQSSSSSGSMSSGPGGGRGFVDLGSLAAASSSSHANQMPITMTISGNSGLSSVSSCSPSSSSCSSVGSNLVSSTSCVPASLLHHVVVPDHTSHQQHQAPFGNQQHQHQDDPSFLPPSSSGSSEQTTGTAAASASGGSVATTVSQQLANAGNAAVMQHLHQHTHHHHEDQRQHLHPLLLQHQHQQQQPPPTKRLKICMDFLRSTLDQSGQLIRAFSDEFFDEIKHKRALVSIDTPG